MKKLFSVTVIALLCCAFALTAFAGSYTIGGNGDAVYDDAIGYVFHIDKVDGTIGGEDSTVITSGNPVSTCGSKWAIWFAAEKVGENVYKAITDGTAMGGAAPEFTPGDNQVAFVIHSSTSNPDNADKYPNWEDKVAALAVKSGNYLALTGVDLASGSVSEGKLAVTATKEEAEQIVGSADPVTVSEPESEAESEPEPVSEPEPASEAESAEPSKAASEPAPESKPEEAASKADSEVKEVELDNGGKFPWAIVIATAAALVAVVAAFFFIKKKNK
ncbi:MAG: hypothetical protein IJQ53_01800 [Clostridia bacterium]|nr:hypothetical protein [Clostridia bacterium]